MQRGINKLINYQLLIHIEFAPSNKIKILFYKFKSNELHCTNLCIIFNSMYINYKLNVGKIFENDGEDDDVKDHNTIFETYYM